MRVAFYARVSTEEQAEKGNIAGQVEFARRYFELHGEREGIDGYEVYCDEGFSGGMALEERPESSRLLRDVEAGRVGEVYVYRLDRLARSTIHVLSAYEFFENHNVALKSMTEMFDTGSSSGKFFMTMLASIAALERDTIVERTQLGKEKAAREGRWTCGKPPFGYRVGKEGRLEIEEKEAVVVRTIHRLYREGMGMVSIAGYLNAAGSATPARAKGQKGVNNGRWGPGQVSIILRNSIYTGEYSTMRRSRRKAEGVKIQVPRLISVEEYNKTMGLLEDKRHSDRGKSKRVYLLRGIIYCGHCGYRMVGNADSRKCDRAYYRCSLRNNRGNKKCSGKQVKAHPLEEAVWNDITGFLQEAGIIKKYPGGLVNTCKEEEEIVRLDSFAREKKESRARVLSLVARGIISEGEAETELKRIAEEISVLNERREWLLKTVRQGKEKCMEESLLRELDKIPPVPQVVKLLVERVEVFTDTIDGERVSRARVKYRFTPEKCGLSLSNSRDA